RRRWLRTAHPTPVAELGGGAPLPFGVGVLEGPTGEGMGVRARAGGFGGATPAGNVTPKRFGATPNELGVMPNRLGVTPKGFGVTLQHVVEEEKEAGEDACGLRGGLPVFFPAADLSGA